MLRNAGHWLTWNQKPREFTGTLQGGRAGKSDEAGIYYLFMPDDGPKLYDAKVKSILGNELRIVGLEKVDGAWVVQEWSCEIIGVS